MAPRIEHVAWLLEHLEDASHDLATSDLVAAAGEADPVPESLVDRDDPPDRTLETQLATIYGVPEESVLVTAGATHANLLAIAAGLETGDRVLVESPGYEPLRATAEWLGGAVDTYRRPRGADYALLPERIVDANRSGTALVVATNRHNPGGRRADRDSVAAAAAAAVDANARLLVDEVYAPYSVGPDAGPFGAATAVGTDGVVVTSSLTKAFGLGGLRIGWLIADPAFVERADAARMHVPAVAAPSRRLARRALFHRDELLARSRDLVRAHHDRLRTFVAGRSDLSGPVFDGATYAFLAHESADGDEVVEAAWERGVLVTPGRFFGDPNRVRVSLGHEPDEMAAALDAFGEALDEL